MALDAESPLANKEPDAIDLAFPLWGSNEVTIAIVVALGVLTGTGLIAWPVFDALTSRQLDNEGRVLLVGMGLVVAAVAGWGLRELRAAMRSRLLVGKAGVQLDASGHMTYRWSQIAGFDVIGPEDLMGLPNAGAVMRLRDGQRIALARLDHLGGDGRNSERAVDQITARVATMNRMLAQATNAPEA